MSKPSRSAITTLLLLNGAIFASCSVDTKNLEFDDDKFDKIENTTSGDGDTTAGDGDGNGGATGDGDSSTSSGDGDSTSSSGDGDMTTSTGDGDGGSTGTGGDGNVEPECTMVGELKCDDSGRQVQVCTGEKFINAGDKCEFVCIDGACGGTCVPATTECVSETESRSCTQDGQWTEPSQCKNVCEGDKCGGSCQPGDRSCDETNPKMKRLCGSDGEWADDGECSTGDCSEGVCTACAGTETQCSADSKGVQTCSDGTFGAPVDCTDQVCVAGACTGECRPALGGDEPQRKCVTPTSGPSTQYQTCGNDGTFGNATNCNFVCVPGSAPGKNDACGGRCKPRERRCEGGVLFQCSDDGLEENQLEDCSAKGESCLPITSTGELGCGVCTPGSEKTPNTQCRQRVVQLCEKGKWVDKQDCAAGLTTFPEINICYQGQCQYASKACAASRNSAVGCYADDRKWICDSGTKSGISTQSCTIGTCTYTSCFTGKFEF